MSIDDRIRTGLTANAEVLAPPVEQQLDVVRRRHRRRTQVRIAAAAAATALAVALPWAVLASLGGRGQQPSTPDRPTVPGTYHVEVRGSGETRTLTGTWTITLDPDGGLVVDPPATYPGPAAGDGETYSVEGDRFTTNVFIGWPGCQRTRASVGIYQVAGTNAGLRFVGVTDSCAIRLRLFGSTWVRQP